MARCVENKVKVLRIAVISDIHSAYAPFEQALTDAKAAGFDQLILLGDLFTYGIDPRPCAELAANAISQDGALLIGGNHDQLYVDLENGESSYFDRLPDWIGESVTWTWSQLGKHWPDNLPILEEWHYGPLLLAHANPFGYGDWTYMSGDTEMARAASVCAQRGFRYGVFGHLHRSRHFVDSFAEIHVVGSVGQPRASEDREPQWAMLEYLNEKLTLVRHNIAFDAPAHCAKIQRHPDLSPGTKNRLCGFFE